MILYAKREQGPQCERCERTVSLQTPEERDSFLRTGRCRDCAAMAEERAPQQIREVKSGWVTVIVTCLDCTVSAQIPFPAVEGFKRQHLRHAIIVTHTEPKTV